MGVLGAEVDVLGLEGVPVGLQADLRLVRKKLTSQTRAIARAQSAQAARAVVRDVTKAKLRIARRAAISLGIPFHSSPARKGGGP